MVIPNHSAVVVEPAAAAKRVKSRGVRGGAHDDASVIHPVNKGEGLRQWVIHQIGLRGETEKMRGRGGPVRDPASCRNWKRASFLTS